MLEKHSSLLILICIVLIKKCFKIFDDKEVFWIKKILHFIINRISPLSAAEFQWFSYSKLRYDCYR